MLRLKSKHRLLCGDSTDKADVDKLMDGQKADMVFTSPPYNANTDIYNATGSFNDKNKVRTDKPLYLNNESDNLSSDEYQNFNAKIFDAIKFVTNPESPIFYNIGYNNNSTDDFIRIINKQLSNGFKLAETISWEKHLAVSLVGNNLTRIVEFIFLLHRADKKPNMYKSKHSECVKNLWKISNVNANHATHKACFPTALPEYAINYYTKNNDILFEPFTGSGSTLIACEKTDRQCYGMEIDPHYCSVIIKRWEEYTGKEACKL